MAFAYGIDASKWDKVVDWNKLRSQGISFVFIKSSQANFEDAMFKQHWAGARDAGLLRGAYHFFVQGTNPITQAQFMLKTLGDDPGELPPVIDVETEVRYDTKLKKIVQVPVQKPVQYAENLRAMLRELDNRLGVRPLIYTAQAFWNATMRINNVYPTWAPTYPLWIANWLRLPYKLKTLISGEVLANTANDIAMGRHKPFPNLPKSWSTWTFWQYNGEAYYLDGLQTVGAGNKAVNIAADLNVYNGTLDQLRGWARVGTGAPTYIDITKFTNQKVLAAFTLAYGFESSRILEGTGLLAQLLLNPSANYSGPAIQDIPNLTFEQELALQSALTRQITNQKMINAFSRAFGDKEYWNVIKRAKLEYIALRRQDPYEGPAIEQLPLTTEEKEKLKAVFPLQ
jgi:GH25 family lysozyme M1 (1,4-beta-N-acetylmuramidase)